VPPECEGIWQANLVTSLPTLIASVAAVIAAWRLREPLRHVQQRADQLYNGEFARGVAAGKREATE